jgi:hypothetical protein
MLRLLSILLLVGGVWLSAPDIGWAQALPAPGPVVINEVQYAPADPANEFIELYNRSENSVDLSALAYADENRDFAPVATQTTRLEPGGYAVLVRDSTAFAGRFPSVAARAPAGWNALNNGGDTIILRWRDTNAVVDSVPYTPVWGGADGRSLERIDPDGPSTIASNFGSARASAGATPGGRNSRFAPDETPPEPIFAEMTGDRRAVVTLSEPVRPASVRPSNFDVGTTTVRAAVLSTDTTVSLTLAAPPSARHVRVTGLKDRVGNTLDGARRPLAYRPNPEDVVLNEILYAPRTDEFDGRTDQVEYVELLSRADRALSLNGLFLTDRPDENGEADTLRIGRRVALPPQGYGVLAAAPTGAAVPDSSQLAAAFPAAPIGTDSVATLLVDAARLGLNNDGGLVRVHRADGQTVAEVGYRPDWHAAGLEETTGTALERLSPTADPQAPDNWSSSPAPSGGTPGRRNAVRLPPTEDGQDTELRVAPSPFSVERDGGTRIRYRLDETPSLVRVQIFDARGRRVRTLEEARLSGPSGELVWNGRNDDGHRVRVGVYVVFLEAVRAENGSVVQLKTPVVVARPLG